MVFGTPSPSHFFSFNTGTPFWSAVAIRPDTADYDMWLFDDAGHATALSSSTRGGNSIDCLTINSNLRGTGDFYPRVDLFSGSGNYTIELAQGADTVGLGTALLGMSSSDVVMVRDVHLQAGVTYAFSLVPQNSGQDGDLFLMASTSGDGATTTRSRSQAAAAGIAAGAGLKASASPRLPLSGEAVMPPGRRHRSVVARHCRPLRQPAAALRGSP